MVLCSAAFPQSEHPKKLGDMLDKDLFPAALLPTESAPLARDRLDPKYYQPDKHELSAVDSKDWFIAAYLKLEIEQESSIYFKENNDLSKMELSKKKKKMKAILDTLEEAVAPFLGTPQNNVSPKKALQVLNKIHAVLKDKFNYKYKESCFLNPSYAEDCLETDCDNLSIIYYSVLRDMQAQPVVMVLRPRHVNIRWKFKNGTYINWETTTGKQISDKYYEDFLGSDYSLEIEGYNSILGYSYSAMGEWYVSSSPEQAVQYFDKALKLNPTDQSIYYNRSIAKYELKNYLDALLDINKAITINPKDAEAYNHRGKIKEALKDFQGSRQDFLRAKDLGYKEKTISLVP
jgi:tetratricopeptide (TPR) repeat protein